ncbi:maternal protein pumilio-like [Scaptodrosophila lebanonensis]|uniref:Maternal protein pumilio-like n=1 Tax=Drosophila lebanonensis TaxID=7225 RepID=A0A6J2TBH7_DROLE|nr:maternal protein pumilio-like [Scaptodrosophila lebanonensis]
MKFLGGNDDRNGRGGVGVGVGVGVGNDAIVGSRGTAQDVDAASAAAAAAAVGYVFQQRPSPGGVGAVGSTSHDIAAAEYAAQFVQKQQQTRWACGDEHGIDNPDKWKYNPPMNPANAAPGAPPSGSNGSNGGPGPIGPIGMGSGSGLGGGMGGSGTNGGLHHPSMSNSAAAANMAAMQQAAAVAKHNHMMSQAAAVAAQQQQQQPPHPQQQQQQQNQQGPPHHLMGGGNGLGNGNGHGLGGLGVNVGGGAGPHPGQMQSQQQQQQQQQQQHQYNSNLLSHAMNNPAAAAAAAAAALGHMPQYPQSAAGSMYDHGGLHPGMNGGGMPKPLGGPGSGQLGPGPQDFVYMGGQPHAAAVAMGGALMPQQNQYMNNSVAAANRNAAITTSTAKKLWEKSDGKSGASSTPGGPLNPLQIPGVGDHSSVWKDHTWSTQGENILVPPRSRGYPHGAASDTSNSGNAGILSPRDSTCVKMVEYVLGGSPTNKESPLSGLEPRMRNLKFDDNDKSHDDKEKANSPFDTNGLKKDDQVTNTNGVIVNGIDDDKGFNRTPGSRQPSPAEETLPRPPTLLDPSQHGSFPQMPHFNQMLMDHAQSMGGGLGGVGVGGGGNGNYPHQQMAQMSQLQPPMMNGVGGMPMAAQSPMLNHQAQAGGPNHMESPGNLLQQQQANFDVQAEDIVMEAC